MSASRGCGHGCGVHGPGVRSGTRTQKQAKEPDVKDEPLSSDPITITEEEDEDETLIKIKVNQTCTLQKARRGKLFKPAGRGICMMNQKCDEPKKSFKMETVASYIKDIDDVSVIMLTNEEKKKKIEDMCNDLEVKNLEQDVEKILFSRLEVKDAKQRIKSLKHILHLLSRYSEDEDEENESKSILK